jgi:enamine deaminase RidA (YjgF/YER057c/UK114 family)
VSRTIRPAPAAKPVLRSALALAALIAPASAAAQTRTPQTVLMSENERGRAVQVQYGFSDAVIAGDTIYLSGIVAARAPGETSLTPAFERAFRHIGRILERAGAGYADIVDMTSFHTDIVPEVEAMSQVQRRLLGSPPPAWTAIQVERLLPENGIAEIKIVARRPGAETAAPGRN